MFYVFLLYLGVFVWAVFFVYRLIRYSDRSVEEKVFLFLLLTALGVYSIDANLNFPIARPQVLVVWALIMALINFYYTSEQLSKKPIASKPLLNYSFLGIALLTVFIKFKSTKQAVLGLRACSGTRRVRS